MFLPGAAGGAFAGAAGGGPALGDELQVLPVADGGGEGVGHVVGEVLLFDGNQHADHGDHLRLVGAAGSGDESLDFGGSVLVERGAVCRGAEERDTARLGHLESRLGVDAREERFDGDECGAMLGCNGGDGVVDCAKARAEGIGGGGAHFADGEWRLIGRGGIDDGVAGGGEAWVNAEDSLID